MFIAVTFSLRAQREVDIWYFGKNKGLDFSGGGLPVVLTNNTMDTWEGCASITDNCTGELQFYTNGITVWNKNHFQMTNGTGLMGGIGTALRPSSTTQSCIIVPEPGNGNIYYIFTNDCVENATAGGFRYSIVDMSLSGGLGSVTIKNTLLLAPGTEKVTGVHHSNRTDIWVVTHGKFDNKFYAYLVTAAGVAAPVITSVGANDQHQTGYMRISGNGRKLVNCDYNNFNITGNTELFDFDNTTGVVSNPVSFGTTNYYGAEFSPDCSKLYVAASSKLDQFDVNAGSAAAIIASKQNVNIQPNFGAPFALQRAKDGKIYFTMATSALNVIHNPNVSGPGCNVQKQAIALGGACNLGITNFVVSFFDTSMFIPRIYPPKVMASSNSTICIGQSATLTASGGMIYSWYPGGQSTSSIVVSPAVSTTYLVIGSNFCGSDSSTITVTVLPTPSIVALSDTTICNGQSALLMASGSTNYSWSPGGQSTSAVVVSPATSTIYTVTGSNACGSRSDSVTVTVNDLPVATTSFTNISCIGGSDGTATVIVTGAAPPYNYSWSPVSGTNPVLTGLTVGTYTVIITDANGCAGAEEITIPDPPEAVGLYMPNAFSPNHDGENDELCLQGGLPAGQAGIEYCIKDFTFTIYNRWGEKVHESSDPAICWTGASNGKMLDPAVFAYYFDAILYSGTQVTKKGNVSLLR